MKAEGKYVGIREQEKGRSGGEMRGMEGEQKSHSRDRSLIKSAPPHNIHSMEFNVTNDAK